MNYINDDEKEIIKRAINFVENIYNESEIKDYYVVECIMNNPDVPKKDKVKVINAYINGFKNKSNIAFKTC